MAFSFIEIEEKKSRIIFLVLFLLILLYFLAAWTIGVVIKLWIIIKLSRFGNYLTSPFLNLEETIFAFLIALLAGIIHWQLSLNNIINRFLSVLNAKPLDEKDRYHRMLENIVEEVCVACGGKRVRVRVIPTIAMNAFTLTDLKKEAVIGVTEGLLSRLTRPQLEAVIAHEMAHIISGDSTIATISSSIFGIYCAMLKVIGLVIREGGRQVPIVSIPLYLVTYFVRLLSSLMIVLITHFPLPCNRN
ncbi:MAG: M48 family metalloprotease [bacterium]